MTRLVRKVDQVAAHRNGIAGEAFTVSLFHGSDRRPMVAVLFGGRGQVAILDVGMLAAGIIEAGVNSWRGDQFEAELRPALACLGYASNEN